MYHYNGSIPSSNEPVGDPAPVHQELSDPLYPVISVAVPGIDSIEYQLFPSGAVQIKVNFSAIHLDGAGLLKEVFALHPELVIPSVKQAACWATGCQDFEANGKFSEEARFARFLFWKHLISEYGFSDRKAAAAGGGKDRITVRNTVNTLLKEEKYMSIKERLWSLRFDARSEIMKTSLPQTR